MVFCYYDIRKLRGELAWEREIGTVEEGDRKRKRKIGEIVSLSRTYFTNPENKKRKRVMMSEMARIH